MKYRIQKYFFLLAVFAIVASCNAPLKEDPNADAIYKSINETYTLHPDGAITQEYQHELKIKSFYAFNRMYGESFIVYNPEFQEVEVLKSQTTMADGKQVDSPENAYNEVLPRFASGAPAYNHLRELVVTHIGLEPEATIAYHYKVESKKDFLPFLMEKITLQKESPVQDYTITVKIPIENELQYNLSHVDNIPRVSTKGDYRIFKWHFRDLAALSGEAHQPHNLKHIPQLSVSTAKTQEAMQWLSKQQPGLSTEMKTAIEIAFTADMTAYDKAEALQGIFIAEMNTFNIPMIYSGYKVRSAKDIWKDNGATPRERALIMAEILNMHNIEATPVYSYQPVGEEPVGNFHNLAHSYVQVKIDNNRYYLSTERSGNLPAEIVEQDQLVDLNTGKILELEASAPLKEMHMTAEVTIDKDLQAKGNQTLHYAGLAVNKWKLYANNSYPQKRLAPFGDEKNTEQIDAPKPEHQIKAKVTIDKAAPVSETGNVYTLSLPNFPKGMQGMHLNTFDVNRKTPMELSNTLTESYDLKIELTPGMDWMALPEPVEIENEAGEVSIIFAQEANKLHVVRKLKLTNKTITPENYAAFKTLINAWVHPKHQEVMFKKE